MPPKKRSSPSSPKKKKSPRSQSGSGRASSPKSSPKGKKGRGGKSSPRRSASSPSSSPSSSSSSSRRYARSSSRAAPAAAAAAAPGAATALVRASHAYAPSGPTTSRVGKSAARAFTFASLMDRRVDYDLADPTIAQDLGIVSSRFNNWYRRMQDMTRHGDTMKKEMNPELVNVCYESHLRGNLFRYKKRPHPNSWVYHPDVNMHTYVGSVQRGHRNPALPLASNAEAVLSSNFSMPLDENTANASVHRVPVEVSTVDEAFDTDAFRAACQASPNLAGAYFAIDCQKCDLPGVDTSGKRCRVLLAEHVCDVRLADVDPKKVHPQMMLNLVAQVLHAVYVLHSHGFVHGAINADNIFVNYVDYGALPDMPDSESLLAFGHGTPAGSPNEMCGNYERVYAMANRERCGARTRDGDDERGLGGIQLVLGGYNGVRKINSSFCRTSDDVASVILTFAQKFGSNFLYFFSGSGDADAYRISENWKGAPLFPFIASKGYTKLVDEHIALVARNMPGKENNEEILEKNLRHHPWLCMFTCASEALRKLCGPSFRQIAKFDAAGAALNIDPAAGGNDTAAGANARIRDTLSKKNSPYTKFDRGDADVWGHAVDSQNYTYNTNWHRKAVQVSAGLNNPAALNNEYGGILTELNKGGDSSAKFVAFYTAMAGVPKRGAAAAMGADGVEQTKREFERMYGVAGGSMIYPPVVF